MKITTTLLLGGLLAALMLNAQAHAAETVRIAVDVPYEPMEYRDDSGQLTGFDVELGNALCAQAQLQCEWIEQGWDGIIPGLLARKYDAIMSSLSITEPRKQQVLFSTPYLQLPTVWLVTANSTLPAPDKTTLEGKRIGVQRGTIQDNYVSDQYGNATVKRYASADDIFVDLSTGRLDVALVDYPLALPLLKKGDYKTVGAQITGPERYFGEGAGIAFRKRDDKLAETFNQALATLKRNGIYDGLYAKYFAP